MSILDAGRNGPYSRLHVLGLWHLCRDGRAILDGTKERVTRLAHFEHEAR